MRKKTGIAVRAEEDEEEEEVVEVVACGCVRSLPNRSRSQNEGERVGARGEEQEERSGESQEEKERRDSLGSNKLAEVEVTLKLLHG